MNTRNEELENMPITQLIWKFSTPAIIAMVTNALYNLVDTAVVGRGVGTLAIGGLAISFPIQMLALAGGQTVGIGAASIVSRNLGAGNDEKAYKTAGNSFAAALMLGIILGALGLIFIDPILLLFGATENILPYAREYMQVIFIGFPFFSFAVSCNNIARAEGSPKVSMVSMIIGAGLNMILDPIFVFGLNLGIRGAALATIVSQIASFCFLVYYFTSGKSRLDIKLHHLILDIKILMEMIAVGSASFVRQAAGSILAIALNNSLRIYGGDLYIAIFGVVNRVMMFMFMPMFGIVQGVQPIIGFNYGANKMLRVKEALYKSCAIITVMLTTSWLILQVFPGVIINIFSDDAKLIEKGIPIMRLMLMVIPILGIQVVGATYFQAIGKAIPAMFLSMSRQIIFFVPLLLMLPVFWGLLGIWVAFPIADVLSAVVTVLWLTREIRRLDVKSVACGARS